MQSNPGGISKCPKCGQVIKYMYLYDGERVALKGNPSCDACGPLSKTYDCGGDAVYAINQMESKLFTKSVDSPLSERADLPSAVMALDIFCRNFCIDRSSKDLAFNCNKCGFIDDDGKRCRVKMFVMRILPDYKDFGAMSK